ncbi:MAG TPA: hypothetical protein VGT98_08630, partial [Candidatus Elarobacter sp.]|nr:hypothetical protein [Candidatus Elarobacter sp.]
FFLAVRGRQRNPAYFAPTLAGDEPEWWTLFAPRVVYPALAAPLFPRRGFAALTDVAAVASVASAVLLYRFLRRFGGPASAAALAVWYATSAPVRDVGVHGLNDSTALLLWIGSLDAMAEMAEDGSGATRFVVLTAALSFTRPVPYLPFGAGLVLALAGARARDGRRTRAGVTIAATAAACAVAITSVLARAGVPSTREHLQRVRESQRLESAPGLLSRTLTRLRLRDDPARSLGRWYATTAAVSVATSLKHAVAAVVPVLAVPALAGAHRRSMPVLAGALLGGLIGCIADPAPASTRRTVVLPLYPVFAAGGVLAVERLLRSRRGR